MDVRYQAFCVADPTFYDAPRRAPAAADAFIAGRVLPPRWRVLDKDDWTVLAPPAVDLAAQGWKIHVSATPSNAREVLDRVWRYCVARAICFKFLRDPLTLFIRNAKYADRSASGKFVTVYPPTVECLEAALGELGAALGRQPGPYILSDARWGEGPLFVRYGGFLERRMRTADGAVVAAIESPDGRLVPDRRQPIFEVPDWVRVPAFLAPHVAMRRADDSPDDFPYRVERPLHFSNGGGVYLAVDTRTERRVVLREARPFAGLDASGHDAVHRLDCERAMLTRLAGTRVAPQVYERFVCWEHHFLAEEYVEGETLGRHFTQRCPLIRADATDARIADYTSWAIGVLDRVRDGLRELHDAGVAFGDLHPHNILVQPDGEIRLVDFESASDAAAPGDVVMGAPGFVPCDGRTGVDADLYALACLHVSLFVPLNALFHLSASKPAEIVASIAERFPVPESFAARVLPDLVPRSTAAAPALSDSAESLLAGWTAGALDFEAVRASMTRAIRASATPARDDRLFPGDIRQFSSGGTGIAFGAAGVLYALAHTGSGRCPEHEAWLFERAMAASEPRLGFYDGLHGIAHVLDALGRRGEALAVLERAVSSPLDQLSFALFDGLPGIGIGLLRFARTTGDRRYRARAMAIADRLATRPIASAAAGDRPAAGLMHGAAGIGLFFVRAFEDTGDRMFLDLAEAELARDLTRCLTAPDGSLQLDEGRRVLPYVAVGSAGIALAIREFVAHRRNEPFDAAVAAIARAAEAEFVVQAGLFNGRAGLMALLVALGDDEAIAATARRALDRHVRRLAWHVLPYRDDIAFPGDQLHRLSMDLATGSAGVLLALQATVAGSAEAIRSILTP